jgi:hypothetical protein
MFLAWGAKVSEEWYQLRFTAATPAGTLVPIINYDSPQ